MIEFSFSLNSQYMQNMTSAHVDGHFYILSNRNAFLINLQKKNEIMTNTVCGSKTPPKSADQFSLFIHLKIEEEKEINYLFKFQFQNSDFSSIFFCVESLLVQN